MSRKEIELPADDAASMGTTIVGGQPPGRARQTQSVPVGVERVLFTAATDSAFREALLADRTRALEARGIDLEASELALFERIPASQLEAAIGAIDTSPANLRRRVFLGAVAAGAAAVALEGCGDDSTVKGIRPDDGSVADYPAATGIRPDSFAESIPTDAAADSTPADAATDRHKPTELGSFGIRPGD